MNRYIKKATRTTPSVILDSKNGMLEIKGYSCPVNPDKEYKNVMNWVEEYVNNPRYVTLISFEIDYFNINSILYFFNLIKVFKKLNDQYQLFVQWIYDNENEDIPSIEYEKILNKVLLSLSCETKAMISYR